MLDIKRLKNERDIVVARLSERGTDYAAEIDELIRLENERVAILTTLESSKSIKNKLSADFGKKKRAGLDTANLSEEIAGFDKRIESCENELGPVVESLRTKLLVIPNIRRMEGSATRLNPAPLAPLSIHPYKTTPLKTA